ncbi:hypothetical protein, partial [Mycobacterium canetti]|uniref:hypothetical protein n=1 Tax=Mycobacterium canetti TaxID=78331 RepID=UPI001E493073
FFLAGQALSHIDTPKLTTFHEKSGLGRVFQLIGPEADTSRHAAPLLESVDALGIGIRIPQQEN